MAPNDADAAYFLGMAMLQDGQNEAAVPIFQRVLKLNPFHASAEFGLARAYRNLGQMDQAKLHQVSFDHIRKAKLGAPITLAYGDQGPLSLVVTVNGAEGEAEAAIPVKFVDVASAAGLGRSAAANKQLGSGACFFDYDKDGKPDLLLTQGTSGGITLFHNVGNGKFEDVTKASGIDTAPGAVSCAASDYDNDEFTDIAIGYRGSRRALAQRAQWNFQECDGSSWFEGAIEERRQPDVDRLRPRQRHRSCTFLLQMARAC